MAAAAVRLGKDMNLGLRRFTMQNITIAHRRSVTGVQNCRLTAQSVKQDQHVPDRLNLLYICCALGLWPFVWVFWTPDTLGGAAVAGPRLSLFLPRNHRQTYHTLQC